MDLVVVPDDAWAAHVADRLGTRLADQADLRLCLPTGNTPAPAYRVFAEAGGSLEQAAVFLLDEFVLPEGSPGRCDAMIRRDLIDRLGAPPAEIIEWSTTGDLEAECRNMEAAIRERGGLDLTLLGLGRNGHIGTNEPGTTADSRCSVIDLDPETSAGAMRYGAPHAPELGLTMGVGTLLESAEIWLLVTGSHKTDILRRTLTEPVSPEIPATYLRTHPNAVVIVDESAAEQL